MDIQELKEYILENNYIPTILEELGCHHIVPVKGAVDDYFSCGNPDGDRKNAINVYENTSLITIDYTRDISNGKKINTDIFSLIEHFKECSFFDALKWVCNILEIDYYKDFDEDLPESLKLTKLILDMQQDNNKEDEEKPLKPIDECILNYYRDYVNDMFYNDGISYNTQKVFEIGYDDSTNRITIPIRDEIGNLIGVKGRIFKEELEEYEDKYISLERYAKSKILYGLYKTYNDIKSSGCVFVGESEKFVMQLYDMGILNCVATGGKQISRTQIDKLTRLCVDIYFVFDKDVELDELQEIANKFIDGVNIYAVYDTNNILDYKESPSDNKDKFFVLKDNVIKLK